MRLLRVEPSGPLGRRPGINGVVDEIEPHRPEPRSRLGKLVPGPQETRHQDDDGGEPYDHQDGRTHGVVPNDIAMRPAIATASPIYPTRSPQTAILQWAL
jgi:hypothetical protein